MKSILIVIIGICLPLLTNCYGNKTNEKVSEADSIGVYKEHPDTLGAKAKMVHRVEVVGDTILPNGEHCLVVKKAK